MMRLAAIRVLTACVSGLLYNLMDELAWLCTDTEFTITRDSHVIYLDNICAVNICVL